MHSEVGEGTARTLTLTALAHAIGVHPGPAISETQASVCAKRIQVTSNWVGVEANEQIIVQQGWNNSQLAERI